MVKKELRKIRHFNTIYIYNTMIDGLAKALDSNKIC